jgi:hypothetical protein
LSTTFVIMDEIHSELQSEHETLAAAWEELQRLSRIPWDQAPNLAPCGSWETCGRTYVIREYDAENSDVVLRSIPGFQIGSTGLIWDSEEEPSQN